MVARGAGVVKLFSAKICLTQNRKKCYNKFKIEKFLRFSAGVRKGKNEDTKRKKQQKNL